MAEFERTHRRYEKQNDNYWQSGIKDSRSKRVRISAEVIEDIEDTSNFDMETLTASEIKDELKKMGVKTRLRCLKKLKKLLVETMKNKENEAPLLH